MVRAGNTVEIFVDDKLCAVNNDIRRQVDVAAFEGEFATSTTCMTLLRPGKHQIRAERTSINVEGATILLKYMILGGTPDRIVEQQ